VSFAKPPFISRLQISFNNADAALGTFVYIIWSTTPSFFFISIVSNVGVCVCFKVCQRRCYLLSNEISFKMPSTDPGL
jgi:hypothetical protein